MREIKLLQPPANQGSRLVGSSIVGSLQRPSFDLLAVPRLHTGMLHSNDYQNKGGEDVVRAIIHPRFSVNIQCDCHE
jgi:hypothetical protein